MVYNDIPGVGLPFKQHERAKSSSEHESCTCIYQNIILFYLHFRTKKAWSPEISKQLFLSSKIWKDDVDFIPNHSLYSTCILVITVTTYLGFRLNHFTTSTIALERATTLISLKWFSTTFLTTSMKDMMSVMVSLI